MLEGLVAWVLNNYLGKYVENLNTDQLSIALLSGKVELENLPLKKDALRHLGLPVEIKAGFIGKIKLQIPVRQIKSAPWVIGIDQLYLVASPLPVYEWDAEYEETCRQELKLSLLDNLEAKWRLENDTKEQNSTYYATSYSSWLNFGTGVVSDIVENIQLKIQDVHIRYEDNISIPGKAMAFGITVDSLSAQSCDSYWNPGFCHWDKMGESFKLLEMQKFGIYWVDLADNELMSKMSLGELAVAMSPTQMSKTTTHYIIPPLSAQAHVKRNRSEQPLRSIDTPRIVCELLLEEVPITLVDWQYDQLVRCVRGLDDIARLRSYRKYKPSCSVKEDPRAWWLYAVSCFYPGKQPAICRPTPTWETCLLRAKQNVEYVRIYGKILVTPTGTLLADEKQLKDDVEWDRDFEELKVLRQLAIKSVTLPNRNNNSTGGSMLQNWFPQWMGWYSSAPTENPNSETLQLEGEILQVLADSTENNTILKRDAVFGIFNFCLKRGCIHLCTVPNDSDSSAPMLELEFKNLSLNITSKPRTASHMVELSLGSLYLKDRITLNTLFPIIMGPPGFERTQIGRPKGVASPRVSISGPEIDPLFYLGYEKKPQSSICDYRLCIRTKCLDIVYQPNAIRWLVEFLCLPHQKSITQSRIEEMKTRTKKELLKNWEQILDGRVANRKTWELQFDISAPQIIFVEQFSEQNSAMAVIDFGRLQLRNHPESIIVKEDSDVVTKSSEDDETFLTPCSTPPQSEASISDDPTLDIPSTIDQLPNDLLDETSLHHKIYERYCVEMTDLQILVGKIKDNWRYAHNKGTSTLHVLDRFNISFQVERRIIHTVDPMYPSLTLNANLPKLVGHVNEAKIRAARNLVQIITTTGLPSPFKSVDNVSEIILDTGQDEDQSLSLDTSIELSRLLLVQFSIDQMSLEVQSRGRSVAELQVAGVKVALTKRPVDLNVTLSVHSLLLVDALQTFGPDFELLVASHKHVGMDSMSGSLRDSEPTSPISPASPDPNNFNGHRGSATSPMALSQALNTLATSPRWEPTKNTAIIDIEALITIDVIIVGGPEPMQIANIQFNNLDIIANQETIVELVGFVQRVFPKSQKPSLHLNSVATSSLRESTESLSEAKPSIGTTELTFDFHRLNVLLLRGLVRDNMLHGKKICTATMCEAKIQATVSTKVEIHGSLGGLQVLDLTPEGHMHQRIVSVGKNPLYEDTHPLYVMSHQEDENTAFSFSVIRDLQPLDDRDVADITVRMASLWYTHSPQFVSELQSCATEFKQYMSNLARSIRTAATDMALGLVHARAEALAQSIYMNARLSSSIYGSTLSFGSESQSPRRRRRSSSMEASGYSSARDTVPQTPYSPEYEDNFIIDLKLDIELDSPVVILPRASNSTEVFIAHLGKISIGNKSDERTLTNDYSDTHVEHFDIEVRDMNLFSLDIANRRVPGPNLAKPEVLYSCETHAKPILHDTILQLNIEREINVSAPTRQSSESNLLLEDDDDFMSNYQTGKESLNVYGSVVTALKLSLSRTQYEQLLDTLQWLTSTPHAETQNLSHLTKKPSNLSNISEEDAGVTTLNMDPHVRAKLFPSVNNFSKPKVTVTPMVPVKISFELPVFTVELRGDLPAGEQALVDLSFRDFVFNYEKFHRYETNIQVSLRAIYMEDLLQPEGSKQRAMVVSSAGNEPPNTNQCVSRSCPDVTYNQRFFSPSHGSLPDHLETAKVFGNTNQLPAPTMCPCATPPPSPSLGRMKPENNLVLISTLIVDPDAPNFNTQYSSIHRSTSVDFNCLDLVVSVESWVVVVDFFSASPSTVDQTQKKTQNESVVPKENTETNITIRSLTVVLVKPDRDIAKANISNVDIAVKTTGLSKEVDGKLGSMSLLDLTLHGQLYRERFVTSGTQALQFTYTRHPPSKNANFDAQLNLEMSQVVYIHTKRFIAELQAFFNHFTQLQAVMKGIRAATSGQQIRDEPLKLGLLIHALSPMILLPVSSKSPDLLVVDLGELLVKNTFRLSGDEGTISVHNPGSTTKRCILDVMNIELQNMDLYAGFKENDFSSKTSMSSTSSKHTGLTLGSGQVTKQGPALLTKKCQLKLQVERNLMNNICHCVPDMSIYGHLSTLDGNLDLSQYRLIRGLLAFNLGEDTERILPSVLPPSVNADPSTIRETWTLTSLKLDLQNVTLRLQKSYDLAPLTCINFITSHLTVETFSNLSQDIDLVSQEILIIDSRFDNVGPEARPNVFTNILQPIKSQQNDLVQAQIHSRKRKDHYKFTVLLNNMRLMAVFDWWEAAQAYIFQEIENVSASPEHLKQTSKKTETQATFEVKLNITDSEIVLVENTAQWDTNAVILKSTTVISFKPKNVEKPLSCSLNNCEMFSCVLGMEEETALSIIDPVTLNMDINGSNKLEAQLQFLTVRLSYYDMKMFLKILDSLPRQMFAQTDEPKPPTQVNKLVTLGFDVVDCVRALEQCEEKIDDAALWLTQNAIPKHTQATPDSGDDLLVIKSVEVKANCVSICIIDDCGDSDVPLLELSFKEVHLAQVLPQLDKTDAVHPAGSLNCVLASDYYNRILSGWEPILEPWHCKIQWEKTLSSDLQRNRLNLSVESTEVLNINATSTLLELYKQVKENWTKDYYTVKENRDKTAYRQRSPFVSFALKNETGSPLYFTTVISDVNTKQITQHNRTENWISVQPNETIPFSFTLRDKLRHQDSHKMRMHQISLRVEGWQALPPVTVDKVGTYFRHAGIEIKDRSALQREAPQARIVFDVALEGSARKLITVRSALLIKNKLPQSMDVKLECQLPYNSNAPHWVEAKTFVVKSDETLAVPLAYAHSEIHVRPNNGEVKYTYCAQALSWANVLDHTYELRTSHSHKGGNYIISVDTGREKHLADKIGLDQPAHRIILQPTVKIVNLLPVDLNFKLTGAKGRISAGSYSALTVVNTENTVEFDVQLENFSTSSSVVIPAGCSNDFSCRMHLEDARGRKLHLQAVIMVNQGARLKILISAPFWIINKTGLPLVFRQAGSSYEAAGQFDEHELARLVTPLLFSFSDNDASPTINARVGNHVVRDGTAQWCSNFHVQKSTQVRKLRVTMRDGRPDTVFVIGIEVRQGRGKYRATNIVTISPRYQLHNRSSYQLAFSQLCFTQALHVTKLHSACLVAMPNSHMPFHWPRLDQEQLLCVSIQEVRDCCWSGGLKIDSNASMHVNIRDANGRVYFLRLEVVLQGATFFIVFTDADTLPPPIRVDNFSEVTITFAQTSFKEVQHSTARAHCSVPYAWDQPTQAPLLTISAPGGVSNTYDMTKLGPASTLTYENFIYIAFVGTFKNGQDVLDPLDVESQELVLDVINSNQVVLARKRYGLRSQLWRMTSEGHLQHEGSSPPLHPNQPRSDNILVLDIDNTAPQPNTFSRLTLRRVDKRRTSTQTWRFTDDGCLRCAHYNMCVQAQDGFFGLRQGNSAVLGMPQLSANKLTEKGVPIERAIGRQRLRPGSGVLSVDINMVGPTRVLTIKDIKAQQIYADTDEREWERISLQQRPNLRVPDEDEEELLKDKRELQFTMRLQGVGISVVCRKAPEELLYGMFSQIVAETVITPLVKRFCISVGNVQFDNQLFDAPVPVVLYVTPPSRNTDELQNALPAIEITAEMQQKLNKNAVIFKYLIIRLKKITVILEERLLLKLFDFVGFNSKEEELINKDENDYETQRLLTEVSAAHAKRYYFGVIQLIPDQIRLSVKTASKLPPHLHKIKRKLGLTLIKFEDAAVDLEAYDKKHPFETSKVLINSIVKHFKDELLWQAGIILGSVDFLGSPLGFVNDVSEGFSGLMEGNVTALVKNLTHGISNSTAKVTESLSDGLGKVSMDDHHEEIRQKIRQVNSGKSRDHIVAGFKGLGFGILGGATSIFKQVYEGASNDGVQGVFSGIGKGLLGTVTKPVVGGLDFASEIARAVRDSSKSKLIPERYRSPRCVQGYGGLLSKYSQKQSHGQQYLYLVNDKNYSEQLIAYEILGSASEDLQCIVSNEKVRIVASTKTPDLTPIIDCHLIDLINCEVITEKEGSENRYYIEIVMHAPGTSSAALVNPDPVKKPRVRCRSLDMAHTISQQINYAKRLYTEHLYTFKTDNITTYED